MLDRRLLIISGKGGVGKTTLAAAVAVFANRRGKKVLVAEVEGKGALASILQSKALTHDPVEIRHDLYAMNISPERALEEYFEVQLHMKRIARPLVTSQLVYYVTHAAPGLRDILMLGKVWHDSTKKNTYDLIVLDTPAAGHAVSMLRSPEGFLHAVPIGPLANHARAVSKWLQDPSEVSIHLVTIGEEMPVNETIETTELLEQTMNMDVAGVFLNMMYPPIDPDPKKTSQIERINGPGGLAARIKSAKKLTSKRAEALYEVLDFYRTRRSIQVEHRRTLTDTLSHTAPVVELPFLFTSKFGLKELDFLADVIEEQMS